MALAYLAPLACTGGSGDQEAGACTPFDYADYKPASSPSLAGAVMPIFGNSCALSRACHAEGGSIVTLGGDQVAAATVLAALVNVDAGEAPGMKYVVPGAPESSWLMRKVEMVDPGCNIDCVAPGDFPDACMRQMPRFSPALAAAQQRTIRDWIASGAM